MVLYWNRPRECMERGQLEVLQLRRLQKTVQAVYHNVSYYREKMQEADIYPEDIRSLADVVNLPFTTKQDLRDSYPYGSFAVPLSQIVRLHASTGTTGKPTVVGYTREDIDAWAELTARGICCVGGGKDDVVQVSYGYGLFTGGLGMHYGAERMGASVIPTSAGNSRRQAMLMNDFGSTILCCTPSYALLLSEILKEAKIPVEDLKLKIGIFGAEPWTEQMRDEIQKRLQINAYNIYGLSEVMGPGVSIECPEKNGMHIWEDHFLPEVINPETGEPLPDGQIGELVISCITKQGMPMVRYRTRDLTSITHEKCACGRTHARIARIMGRSDDMLIIRGVNVFPSQVESALLAMGEVSPHYHLVVTRENNLDILEVQVEVSENLFSDKVRSLEGLAARVKKEVENTINLGCKISLVEPRSLPRSEGKSVRVTDLRKI
ncbi:MAG: phenylacetate--CoA ligase [Clostridia bacterium]|nr:phenylacetate--CoA ligase [Clostridia bacterium]MDD4798357.1 phenylacetate--CoA ligase [Clostridia bacterium]